MKIIAVLLVVGLPVLVLAQSSPPDVGRISQTADLSLATNGDFSTAALSVNRLYGLGQSNRPSPRRFQIGYGLRLTAAVGRNTDYRTAPSDLVKGSGHGSALGLISKTIDANIDTLRLAKTQAISLNISLNLQYSFSHRVAAGFNIDLIGFTVGPDQQGTFIANSPVRSPLSGTEQTARLTPFNILLGDQSDRGSLNSELYVRYRLNPRISLRTGLSFSVNEYTTTRKLTLDNDRFRSGTSRGLLAVSYHF